MMLYIFTALYCEADCLIQLFQLKKIAGSRQFLQFASESKGIRLTVTGPGEIAAAAAVSSICTQYKPGPADFLLNMGICAGVGTQEGIFLANKITEQASGRTFYPDVLYRHPFDEASLMTGMVPWMGDIIQDTAADASGPLYDMEAAAVYQAGAYVFGPHQMLFLKIVSDHGRAEEVSARQTKQLMERHKKELSGFITQLLEAAENSSQQHSRVNGAAEEALVQKLCRDMHCSKTMEESVRKQIRYLALTGFDYKTMIGKLYEEKILPCRDKRAGKRVFSDFKRQLF